MRDLLPDQMRLRQRVLDAARQVFETFGFEPVDTPAVELWDTLRGKYGPDAERLIFRVEHGRGETAMALRYDLSIPFARLVANHPELVRPFRRYQIGPAWRGERPQKGRYREFYQCDVDIVGSASMLADCEVIAASAEVLRRLGLADSVFRLNSRKLLNAMGAYAGVPPAALSGLYRAIDKLDRLGIEGVRTELLAAAMPDGLLANIRRTAQRWISGHLRPDDLSKETRPWWPDSSPQAEAALDMFGQALGQAGAVKPPQTQAAEAAVAAAVRALRPLYKALADHLPEAAVERMIDLLRLQGQADEVLAALPGQLVDQPDGQSGADQVSRLLSHLAAAGLSAHNVRLDLSLARGLEYYTGPIVEIVHPDLPDIGSLGGGGRYDQLIGLFQERSYPATGISLGCERLMDALAALARLPDTTAGRSQVLVTLFEPDLATASLTVARLLRGAGLRTIVYLDAAPVGDQIRFALKNGVAVVAVIGPQEIADGTVTLRNLRLNQQVNVPRDAAAGVIESWLDGQSAA
jgi:histidyl-tRNA synthetase